MCLGAVKTYMILPTDSLPVLSRNVGINYISNFFLIMKCEHSNYLCGNTHMNGNLNYNYM